MPNINSTHPSPTYISCKIDQPTKAAVADTSPSTTQEQSTPTIASNRMLHHPARLPNPTHPHFHHPTILQPLQTPTIASSPCTAEPQHTTDPSATNQQATPSFKVLRSLPPFTLRRPDQNRSQNSTPPDPYYALPTQKSHNTKTRANQHATHSASAQESRCSSTKPEPTSRRARPSTQTPQSFQPPASSPPASCQLRDRAISPPQVHVQQQANDRNTTASSLLPCFSSCALIQSQTVVPRRSWEPR